MGSAELHVLVVEDNEDDALLIVRQLEGEGWKIQYSRVDTGPAMAAAIEGHQWEAIISDYSLPNFNALAALDIAKEKGLDIPFIVVSGTIGEDVAVQTMVAGAHDYVMKDKLNRLGPALRRELQEVEVRRDRRKAEEELLESEKRYRSLVENLPVVSWETDRNGRTTFISPNVEQVYGYCDQEIYKRSDELWFERIHPEDRQEVQQAFERLFTEGEIFDIEYRVHRKDGQWMWIHDKAKRLYSDGETMLACGAFMDVTEHKRAEEALRESEQRYRTLFETATDAILVLQGGQFVDCNPRALKMFGCRHEQITGQTPYCSLFAPPTQPDGQDSEESARKKMRRAFSGEAVTFEWLHKKYDGTLFYAEVSLGKIELAGGAFMLAIVRDNTPRKKAEEKLLEYQRKLRSLVSELTLAEERQRRQMATDLHDGACQELAISKLRIQSFLSEHNEFPADNPLKEACDTIDQVACDLRELTLDLSPPTLYKFGLESAVEELLDEQLRLGHGICYEFNGDTDAGLLADDLQILLFRCIREVMINIIKHARAQTVKVRIERHPESVEVVVEDDGIGFDVEKIGSSASKAGGFGLFNVKERLEYVGGSFTIESQPGSGSRFTMVAPNMATAESN